MEKSKLGEASFYENDLFSPPSFEEKIYFDDIMPPIYDDYNDEYDILPADHDRLLELLLEHTVSVLLLPASSSSFSATSPHP